MAICTPVHNFIVLYLRNWGTYRSSEKKLVKQQYVLHMSSQYGKRRPTNSWDRFRSFGHPSIFQRVSRLDFVTAATSLTGGQPNFARCLAVSWAGTLYIYIFGGCCSLIKFCPVQNSLYVQVLHSPILAALLHGTPAAGAAKLCGVVQGMELPNFGREHHLYSAGRPSRWASAHILVSFVLYISFDWWMCAFVAIGFVFQYQAKRLARETSLKWPILCWVVHKTTAQSMSV